KYRGGVCSGLEHYLGIDALWIRLFFIFFALFTGFGFIAYILLWILVPEAGTTSQKLDMKGEPVNISNIERKVKEGFEDVTEKVKNVDYEKVGKKVKSSTHTFFDTLGDIIMFLFKVVGKFIGILLIIIGAATLIGLFIGLFTVGVLDIVHIPGIDFYDMVSSTGTPVWLVSLLAFFAIGIPFFFLLYLGLKILVNNLKSIGNIAKFSLLGLWLLSIIGLTILGVKQASAHAYTGTMTEKEELYFPSDTLNIAMRSSELYENQENIGIADMVISYTESGERLLYSEDVRFDIKKSEDSLSRIRIRKDADGSSFKNARDRASKIAYSFASADNSLILDDFLTTGVENKVRDQEIRVTLYVPEGQVIRLDESTRRNIARTMRYDQDLYRSDMVDYYWSMADDGELKCLGCPEDIGDDNNNDGRIIINEDGVDININDDEDSFEMKIDEDGLKIKAKEKD
ncbi:MAG: PspC domain-containing protein, partial [Flavobacteriaceae bacterium]